MLTVKEMSARQRWLVAAERRREDNFSNIFLFLFVWFLLFILKCGDYITYENNHGYPEYYI